MHIQSLREISNNHKSHHQYPQGKCIWQGIQCLVTLKNPHGSQKTENLQHSTNKEKSKAIIFAYIHQPM